MQFCHWCSKSIKTGRFCSPDCLQAAAEMPELINHQALPMPRKVSSTRRVALGVIGALALIGGSIAALYQNMTTTEPAPTNCILISSTLLPEPVPMPMPEPIEIPSTVSINAQVSAYVFTYNPSAKTTEIDAMVQSTLPRLRAAYLETLLSSYRPVTGTVQLSFLINPDGSVEWVSRQGQGLGSGLDSAALQEIQNLRFSALPVCLTSICAGQSQGVEVNVIYRFGSDNVQNDAPVQNLGSFTSFR